MTTTPRHPAGPPPVIGPPEAMSARFGAVLVATLFAAGIAANLIGDALTDDRPDCGWHTVVVSTPAGGTDGTPTEPIRVCLDRDNYVIGTQP